MLMITRRAGERVIIGDDIVVTLVEVSGQSARLGIEAPKSTPIYREEIWVEVMRENEESARAATGTLPDVVALGDRAPAAGRTAGKAPAKKPGRARR